MQEFTSIDEAILKIKELEKELHETELKLCKFDIEKNEYIKKFSKADRERVRLLNEAVKLRIDLIDVVNAYNAIKDSNLWKKTKIIRDAINSVRSIGKTSKLPEYEEKINVDDIVEVHAEATEENIKKVEKTHVNEENMDFSSLKTDIKTIAFYHQYNIEEHDGKASIECNKDNGSDLIKNQIALAKQHGIYGFAFDYNWLPEQKLNNIQMQKLFNDAEIDFHYMVVWSNEKANMRKEDAKSFIYDIKAYLEDSRYIKVDGKPVIGLKHSSSVENFKNVLKAWKKTAKECGLGDILVWVNLPNNSLDDIDFIHYIDGFYQDRPVITNAINENHSNEKALFDYRKLIEEERHFKPESEKIPVYRTSMLNGFIVSKENEQASLENYSVDDFYMWNCINTAYTRHNLKEEERFVFVDAWNSLNEETSLEPDKVYGYGALNALSKAVFNLPFDVTDFSNFDEIGFWKTPLSVDNIFYTGGDLSKNVLAGWDTHLKKDTKIAIQAHVFYPDLIEDTCEYLDNIPYSYDLYITTNEKYKATYIDDYLKTHCTANRYFIDVVANKGRDVMPFIMQMKDHIKEYDYICHIHTKKSLHNDVGDIWRKYLYDNLIGSTEIIRQIFYLFESQQDIGVIFPENMANLKKHMVWGVNREYGEWLFKKMNMEERCFVDEIIFPAGNMFWARTDAVRNVFEIKYKDSDFPEEEGQVDGTVLHAIERIWLFVAENNGYKYQIVRNVLDDVALFE